MLFWWLKHALDNFLIKASHTIKWPDCITVTPMYWKHTIHVTKCVFLFSKPLIMHLFSLLLCLWNFWLKIILCIDNYVNACMFTTSLYWYNMSITYNTTVLWINRLIWIWLKLSDTLTHVSITFYGKFYSYISDHKTVFSNDDILADLSVIILNKSTNQLVNLINQSIWSL